jgi:O-antigen/teichoic acid export membrane protein
MGTVAATRISRVPAIRQHLQGKQACALVDQVLVSGSNFLTGVILARSLGLSGFGVFTLAWTAVLFLLSTQLSLITSPMMSIGPKQSAQQAPTYYGCVLAHGAIFALLGSLVLLVGTKAASWLAPQWGIQLLALPLAAAAFAYLLQDLLRRYFYSNGRSAAALATDGVSYLGQVVLLLLLWKAGHLDCAAALWLCAATSLAAVVIALLMLAPVRVDGDSLRRVAARHWNSSQWLLGSNLMQWISGNAFFVTAPVFLGVAAVAVLRAAQNLLNVTNVWFQSLENVIPPEAARRLQQRGTGAMRGYLRQSSLVWGGMTALFALLVSILADPLLVLVYGNAFEGFGYAVRWSVCTCILTTLMVAPTAGLRAFENTKPIFYANVISTVAAAVLAVPLIRGFALRGAIGGLLLTRIAMLAVLVVSFRRAAEQSAATAGSGRHSHSETGAAAGPC